MSVEVNPSADVVTSMEITETEANRAIEEGEGRVEEVEEQEGNHKEKEQEVEEEENEEKQEEEKEEQEQEAEENSEEENEAENEQSKDSDEAEDTPEHVKMLVLHTAKVKKEELWFIVNGVPIRYSLREMALISGLPCHAYPDKNYERLGSSGFMEKHFESGKKIKYEHVEKKLKAMKGPCLGVRLKMAILYFLCSVILGPKKTVKRCTIRDKKD
ncbi:hypothetical protein N665_0051s0023 [Sinapis alba]|nr:hypothetical protein N665_0051s0023 [Sinapis alba]